MRSIKLRQINLLFYLLFSICSFIFLMPLESIGIERINNQTDASVSNDYNVSKADTSLLKEVIVLKDSAVSKSEKPEFPIPEKSPIQVIRPQNEMNQLVLWLLKDNNVSEFRQHLIDFGNDHMPLFLRKSYMHFVERTYTFPIIILFLLLIIVLMVNVTIVLLVMYFTNNRMNYKERYVSVFRKWYEEILSSYLFGEIEWDKAVLKLKKLKKPLNRKILTDVLLTFKENLRGEMDNQIPQIFMKLGLEKDSLKLTKSALYHRRIEGLKALTNLSPENAKEIIPNYLNDAHFLVRTEAQVSYVRLHPENAFEFLRTLNNAFPRWTQLSSFYIFRLHQVPVPAFVDYLESEIPTVRNFCLRMMIFFQQIENASAIFKMLDSPLEMTRFLSIRAINDLRLYDGKQKIKSMYQTETGNNKIEIIKALKNIGHADDFDFLQSIIESGSISLKTEACRSLYFVNNEGREKLNILSENKDLEIDQFLAHVTDPRN